MNDIVLLNLRISMWGVSRVLPDHEYEVDADKAMVRATKKILECPEYEFLLQLKFVGSLSLQLFGRIRMGEKRIGHGIPFLVIHPV